MKGKIPARNDGRRLPNKRGYSPRLRKLGGPFTSGILPPSRDAPIITGRTRSLSCFLDIRLALVADSSEDVCCTMSFPVGFHLSPASSYDECHCVCQIFSFVSDVSIAGFNFSAAPTIDVPMSFPAKNIASAHQPTSRVYIHIVDRRRTLRTWLLHPGGVNAAVAYALPTAAPQVPMIQETDDTKDKANNDGIADVESPVPAQESNEEMLDPSTTALATRAFIAYVFPSRLPGKVGPGILVVAGLTLSRISFLPEGDTVPMWHIESPIWETSEVGGRLSDSHQEDPGVPRVLGMRGIFSQIGNRQALAVMWAKRPCFQVLDVGRIGFSTEVQEIPMDRRHR